MICPKCHSTRLRTTNTYAPSTRSFHPAVVHLSRAFCEGCGGTFTVSRAILVTDPGAKGLSNLPLILGLEKASIVEEKGGKLPWRIVGAEGTPLLHPRLRRPLDDGGQRSREEAELLLATIRALQPRDY